MDRLSPERLRAPDCRDYFPLGSLTNLPSCLNLASPLPQGGVRMTFSRVSVPRNDPLAYNARFESQVGWSIARKSLSTLRFEFRCSVDLVDVGHI